MRFGSRRLLRQRGPPQSPLRCGKASPLTSVAFRLGYFTKPVILSVVPASRSEAGTESKDPISACSSTSTARSSHYALYQAPREFLAVFVAPATGMGSFDSQASRKREARFAQDDRCWVRLTSTINVFVVRFPKMRIPARDGPTKTVILSGVNAPRSEAFTQSKEPMPTCSSTGTARRSNPTLYEAP